jgi:2-hydroxychromene-2-carboxylate isomerase
MSQTRHIQFYYDPISPYAYLAFEQLPKALEGLSYSVSYTPILFAAMLKTHGQLGPAEIAPKRDWTYRQVLWQAKQLGIEFQMPANHPFGGVVRRRTRKYKPICHAANFQSRVARRRGCSRPSAFRDAVKSASRPHQKGQRGCKGTAEGQYR